MAEEDKAKTKITSVVLKVVAGLIFIALGVCAIIVWWSSLLMVFKGCIGLFLVLVGLISLAIAKE
jgi:membrane-bound ClpP family serine protease